MRPEAAAGAREARGRVCHCPADGPRRPPPPRGPESPTPWRPWILTPQETELPATGNPLEPGDDRQTPGSKGAFGFQHPVRLYLPISKRQEYLQSSGEKVLASFPVQATIHFYNDESDSDDEEQEEETQSSELQCQETEGQAENGPGGKGKGQLTNLGRRSVGHGGLSGHSCTPLRRDSRTRRRFVLTWVVTSWDQLSKHHLPLSLCHQVTDYSSIGYDPTCASHVTSDSLFSDFYFCKNGGAIVPGLTYLLTGIPKIFMKNK
ncbi:protein ripply3 [Felis catus]|uniref:Protein ripply3 n=1 Tax=Felis catus TaxID=9685 RepID=A0ABI7YID9_FELCA|nr:protein ripply3 [Felis catus]